MPRASMICLAILLLWQAFGALRAGRITIAGICLGGFAFALVTLRSWYQASSAPGHGTIAAGTPPVARGAVVAAIVYPEQLARIGEVLTAIVPAEKDVLVLLVHPTPAPSGAPALAGAEDIFGELAREVDRSSRRIHVMCAFGSDVAAMVLDVARTFGASRVVVLRAEDTDASEERRSAIATWDRLPAPRPSVRVDLVGGGADVPYRFELPAA